MSSKSDSFEYMNNLARQKIWGLLNCKYKKKKKCPYSSDIHNSYVAQLGNGETARYPVHQLASERYRREDARTNATLCQAAQLQSQIMNLYISSQPFPPIRSVANESDEEKKNVSGP